MKTITILLFLFVSAMSNAQTKVIAHKSHSGSGHAFAKAYKQNLFDINRSNFGDPGQVPIIVLDTIVALNDSVTVMIMRESIVCYHPWTTTYTNLKAADFKPKTDTLVNDKIFKRQNSPTFIKSSAPDYRFFSNPIDSVVFVGFEE